MKRLQILLLLSITIILVLILFVIITISIALKQESFYENRVENLEKEITMLKSEAKHYQGEYEFLKEEYYEAELYFEYYRDIDRLNENLIKEGVYIAKDGEIISFEVATIEYEVDYAQFYEDVESFLHYYMQWYSSNPQITFEHYIEDIDLELYNRLEYYEEVYYEVRPWKDTLNL